MAKIICENRSDFNFKFQSSIIYLIEAKVIVMKYLILEIFKEKNILMTTEFEIKMNLFKVKLS